MRDFQSDSHSKPPPIAALLVCGKCQGPMRLEMKTEVVLSDHLCTVTLVCERCGTTLVETCEDDGTN